MIQLPNELNTKEILRYLGGGSQQPPQELLDQIKVCAAQVLQAARPKTVWRLFPLSGTSPEGTSVVFQGENIKCHLADCTHVICMAATLGPDVESLLMRTQVRDMAQALIMDACASAAVEALCDSLEEELTQLWQERGHWLTDRYSPGYGDFPLSQQKELCALLDIQRRIGVTLSASGIMLPRKTVTAVLGVADSPRHHRSQGCAGCSMYQHCQMRKGGTPCAASI